MTPSAIKSEVQALADRLHQEHGIPCDKACKLASRAAFRILGNPASGMTDVTLPGGSVIYSAGPQSEGSYIYIQPTREGGLGQAVPAPPPQGVIQDIQQAANLAPIQEAKALVSPWLWIFSIVSFVMAVANYKKIDKMYQKWRSRKKDGWMPDLKK